MNTHAPCSGFRQHLLLTSVGTLKAKRSIFSKKKDTLVDISHFPLEWSEKRVIAVLSHIKYLSLFLLHLHQFRFIFYDVREYMCGMKEC